MAPWAVISSGLFSKEAEQVIIRQAHLARELDVSEITVHRSLKALYRDGEKLSDMDAITVFAVPELRDRDFTFAAATTLLSELSEEIRYVIASSEHRCWVVFINTERASFSKSAITFRHLEALINAHPPCIVLALHEIILRGEEQLKRLKARLANKDAA